MYGYYALASLGPAYQKYLWWKRYITQIQLIQFVICSTHALYFLFDTSCTCSKLLIGFQLVHSLLFLYLFGSFYIRTYNKEKLLAKQQKLKDEQQLVKRNANQVEQVEVKKRTAHKPSGKTL